MKATFFERLSSYLIDTLIVSLIFSLICLGFGNYTSEAEKAMLELENKMLENSITMEEYLVEYKDILYDYQKENVLQSGISVALTIAYFVVFQYMNKGQTIGKKILNIRVVDKKSKKSISILKGLLRSFIVFSVVSGTCCILFLYIFNRDTYVISYSALLFLEAIFTIVTMILVLYKKDGRGLHDMMANTIVIKEKK